MRRDQRPAFGLLPWFAFLRRAFVRRFAVFFDIGEWTLLGHAAWDDAHVTRSSAAHVFTMSSVLMSRRAALSHPYGCHSS